MTRFLWGFFQPGTACTAWSFSFKYHNQSKILKYIFYIQSKDEESLVKTASLMSFDLHCNGKHSFHSYLMNMSQYFKLPDFNPDLLDIAMVKSYVSSMKQEYISYWQNTLQHSQKLEFYRSFKTDHTSSSYLDLTRGTAGRRALVKLRISNHKLMIEIGRYNQTTKDNRHCLFCGCNVIEDKVHFLFQCPTYSVIRNKFYYKVKTSKYYPVTYKRFDLWTDELF